MVRKLYKRDKKLLDNYKHIQSVDELPVEVLQQIEKGNDWECLYSGITRYLTDNYFKEKYGA